MFLKESELILNADGSVYHLNIKPEHIANTIILVGDQDRVAKVTQHFSTIEFTTQKREFKTTTGTYNNQRLTVISTGIGADNIDIVFNELDALVNINLQTRKIKKNITSLTFVRIGTSGALQADIPIDSFLISTHGLDINGMLHSYQIDAISNTKIEDAFVAHTNWSTKKAHPILIANNQELEKKLSSAKTYSGITVTAGGFYGPQGRVLRLALEDANLPNKLESFQYNGLKISNLEMETSAIYGMAKLLGHKACSINAIIANRATSTFSKNPEAVINNLIQYTLTKLTE